MTMIWLYRGLFNLSTATFPDILLFFVIMGALTSETSSGLMLGKVIFQKEIRAHDCVDSFKSCFKTDVNELQVLYYYGERWPSVHHARMRVGCSKLNNDLFSSLHVTDSPAYACVTLYEYAGHFIPSLYVDCRQILLNDIQGIMLATTKNLLFGSTTTNIAANEKVFNAVHPYMYIIDTKRFK